MREASRCQEQSSSMGGDLNVWTSLEQEVELSCEVIDKVLVVEDLPLSFSTRYM